MISVSRVPIVLAAVAVLVAGLAVPPLAEDHLEPGFCSADCPVQHAGQGTALAPAPAPTVSGRQPALTVVLPGVPTAAGRAVSATTPRAPPLA